MSFLQGLARGLAAAWMSHQQREAFEEDKRRQQFAEGMARQYLALAQAGQELQKFIALTNAQATKAQVELAQTAQDLYRMGLERAWDREDRAEEVAARLMGALTGLPMANRPRLPYSLRYRIEHGEPTVTKPKGPAPLAVPIAGTTSALPEAAPPPTGAAMPIASAPPAAMPVTGLPQAAMPIAAQPVAAEPIAAQPIAAEPIAAQPQAAAPEKAAIKAAAAATPAPKYYTRAEVAAELIRRYGGDIVTPYGHFRVPSPEQRRRAELEIQAMEHAMKRNEALFPYEVEGAKVYVETALENLDFLRRMHPLQIKNAEALVETALANLESIRFDLETRRMLRPYQIRQAELSIDRLLQIIRESDARAPLERAALALRNQALRAGITQTLQDIHGHGARVQGEGYQFVPWNFASESALASRTQPIFKDIEGNLLGWKTQPYQTAMAGVDRLLNVYATAYRSIAPEDRAEFAKYAQREIATIINRLPSHEQREALWRHAGEIAPWLPLPIPRQPGRKGQASQQTKPAARQAKPAARQEPLLNRIWRYLYTPSPHGPTVSQPEDQWGAW